MNWYYIDIKNTPDRLPGNKSMFLFLVSFRGYSLFEICVCIYVVFRRWWLYFEGKSSTVRGWLVRWKGLSDNVFCIEQIMASSMRTERADSEASILNQNVFPTPNMFESAHNQIWHEVNYHSVVSFKGSCVYYLTWNKVNLFQIYTEQPHW